MGKLTTIQVSKKFKKRIGDRGKKGESYEKILERLIIKVKKIK